MKDQEYIDETVKVFREMFGQHLMDSKEQVVRWTLWCCIDRGFQSGYVAGEAAEREAEAEE